MTRFLLTLVAIVGLVGLAGAYFDLAPEVQLWLAGLATVPAVFGMVLDERTEFADAFTIPTAIGRGLLGDVYDLKAARPPGSVNKPLYLVIQITTAVTSAGAATVSFELVSDAQAAIATDGTATIHAKTMDFPKATLVAGYTVAIPLPGFKPDYEQFLGVLSNVGAAALTAGAVNAFLTDTPKQWVALDNGIAGI